ncbi:MAG: Hpt domain-containing protein [Proteobacteria bacterium]|nr:Hpt domain-containing protein [Pseudomonadota bacterium]MBI3496341.1 Hpt domain-containing protein [Pseudomonadota bacterium]
MAEFVMPPSSLRDKVGKGIPGGGVKAMREAEAAAKRHLERSDYAKIAQSSLDRLSAELRSLIADPADRLAAKRAYEIAHDLRGEGGSFGYPAVSQVATLIVKVLDETTGLAPDQVEVIRLQIATLRAIVRLRAKGRPYGTTLEVINGLELLVERLAAFG